MTQNERLRALLEQARERIGYCPCGDSACEPGAVLVERINATLSEPVCPCGGEDCTGVEDGLRHQCGGVREACGVPGCVECGRAHALLHGAGIRADNAERRERARIEERDEARAEVATLRRQLKEAFYRGAEAMRQDAVKMLRERHQWKVQRNYGPNPTEVEDCAWEVNALPLPAKETQWPSSSETSTSSN